MLIFLIFYTYEHLEFHAQLSWAWKKKHNIGPWRCPYFCSPSRILRVLSVCLAAFVIDLLSQSKVSNVLWANRNSVSSGASYREPKDWLTVSTTRPERCEFFAQYNQSHPITTTFKTPGRVAQSVGHLTRKSGVLGSIPGLATYFRFSFRFFKKGSCQLLAKVCARSTG